MSELLEAIQAGDVDRCRTLPLGWTEAQRRAEAGATVSAFRAIRKQYWANLPHTFSGRREEQLLARQYDAGALALLATAGFGDVTALFEHVWTEHAYDILAARRPAWLGRWCEWSIRENDTYWPAVRRFVREGVVERPETDMYYLWTAHRAAIGRQPRQFLLDDPELLECELWKLFEIEGNRLVSLAQIEKFWPGLAAALVELSREGRVSRARLLDASLGALTYDFPQFRAGWFSRFHEELAPTVDERAERLESYLLLLASKIPPTVSFALGAVAIVDRAGRVPPDQALDALGAVFAGVRKSAALLALKLVAGWTSSHPELAAPAAAVVRPALDHGARDVREAAQKLLARLDPAAAPRPSDAVSTVPRDAPAPPTTAPPSLPKEPITPIGDVEELVMALSAILENEGPPDELERVLDGVSRLCAERPTDFDRLTGPLRKRAALLAKNGRTSWDNHPVRALFSALGCAWLAGTVPETPALRGRDRYTPADEDRATHARHIGVSERSVAGSLKPGREKADSVGAFLRARLLEVAERAIRREPSDLLAAPTHPGGWIDPAVFVGRLAAQDSPSRLDLIQALLRLMPDRRADALTLAAPLGGEIGEAVRHALGADDATVGDDAALWAAAARARDPAGDDPAVERRHGSLGPDTSRAARIALDWARTETKVDGNTYRHAFVRVDLEPPLVGGWDIDFPTVLLYNTPNFSAALVRWASMVSPANRESWWAVGARLVGDNLDWWQAEWGNRVYLETLLGWSGHFSEMARTLLGLGLAAKDPGEGTLATDILLAALADGRLSVSETSGMLAQLFSWDQIVFPRVARRLLDGARHSAYHASAIQDAVCSALATTLPVGASGLAAALDLLVELTALTGQRALPDSLTVRLMSLKGAGKAATLAKRLLSGKA